MAVLLNLAEFMERAERPLGIAWRSLAKLAGAANAFAKGLHYTEHLHSEGHADIASLISLNGRLGQHDAAKGILTAAEGAQHLRGANAATDGAERTELGAQPKELTFDLLATSPELDWKRALHAYEVRQEEQPDSVAIALGRMRCARLPPSPLHHTPPGLTSPSHQVPRVARTLGFAVCALRRDAAFRAAAR